MDLPDAVRAKALTNGASAWLEGLPSLVSALSDEWGCTVGTVYPDATEAYVAGVTLADGTPAVLKLMIPRGGDHAAHEITVLRLAGGDGCVRLLRYDVGRGAMLLERLGPSLYALGLPYERRLEILVDAARRVWRPAPDAGLPSGADKGRWLAGYVTTMWGGAGPSVFGAGGGVRAGVRGPAGRGTRRRARGARRPPDARGGRRRRGSIGYLTPPRKPPPGSPGLVILSGEARSRGYRQIHEIHAGEPWLHRTTSIYPRSTAHSASRATPGRPATTR